MYICIYIYILYIYIYICIYFEYDKGNGSTCQFRVSVDNEFINNKNNKLYYYLKSTEPPAPRFYGQPKIRKPGVPILPIVSYSGSPLHKLNKHLASILKASVKDENNNAKNSTTFSNYSRNVPIEDDKIMVSFDVTPLYTNIPIIDTLNTKYNQGLY